MLTAHNDAYGGWDVVTMVVLLPFFLRFSFMMWYMFVHKAWPMMRNKASLWWTYTKLAFAVLYGFIRYKWNERFNKDKTVKLINRNQVEIAYTFRDQEYRIRSRVKRGAKMPITILAGDNDVTNELLPYVGPGEDFHGITYTPEDFGYDRVTIRRDGMDDVIFEGWEVINIQ